MKIECVLGSNFPNLLRETAVARSEDRLGRFAATIESVNLVFKDLNGPKGGIDVECLITIQLRNMPDVIVREVAESPGKAMYECLNRAERAVAKTVQKQRSRRQQRRRQALQAELVEV